MSHSATHHDVKIISRSGARSATGAAAYASGSRIASAELGTVHDYRRKSGVVSTDLIGWAGSAEDLWNAAEAADTRKNSRTARETVVALPHELTDDERHRIVLGYAGWLHERYGVAVQASIHRAHRRNDDRNDHAHILWTTRSVAADGTFGAKVRIVDDGKTGPGEIEAQRAAWSGLVNEALERHGTAERVDHRSHARREAAGDAPAQTPLPHLGPARVAVINKWSRTASAAEERGQRVPEAPAFWTAYRETATENAEVRDMWERARKMRAAFEAALAATQRAAAEQLKRLQDRKRKNERQKQRVR